jgi:hypothetical protein
VIGLNNGRNEPTAEDSWARWTATDETKFLAFRSRLLASVPDFVELQQLFGDLTKVNHDELLTFIVVYIKPKLRNLTAVSDAPVAVRQVVAVLEESLSGRLDGWYAAVYNGFVDMLPNLEDKVPIVLTSMGPHLSDMWQEWLRFNPSYVIPKRE